MLKALEQVRILKEQARSAATSDTATREALVALQGEMADALAAGKDTAALTKRAAALHGQIAASETLAGALPEAIQRALADAKEPAREEAAANIAAALVEAETQTAIIEASVRVIMTARARLGHARYLAECAGIEFSDIYRTSAGKADDPRHRRAMAWANLLEIDREVRQWFAATEGGAHE